MDRITPREIDELRLLKIAPGHLVAIPESASGTLEDNVRAAALADVMNLRSIDYTRRQYVSGQPVTRATDALSSYVRDIAKEIIRGIEGIARNVAILERQGLPVGTFAANMALARLESTFRCAVFLMKHGYFIESSSLARVILEQTAWAYAVRGLADTEAALAVTPTRQIGRLKSFIPYAGTLYGALSDHTHVTPRRAFPYIDVSKGQVSVVMAGIALSASVGLEILLLADGYNAVFEAVLADWLPPITSIAMSKNGTWELRNRRQLWLAFSSYRARLARILTRRSRAKRGSGA